MSAVAGDRSGPASQARPDPRWRFAILVVLFAACPCVAAPVALATGGASAETGAEAARDSAASSADSTSPAGTDVGAEENHPALAVGEKLTFTVRYGLVRAGTATMEIASLRRFRGRPVFHIVSTASSNSVFDKVYPVRDRIVSLLDQETLQSLYFEKHLREGSYRADQSIRFDHARGMAVYHDGEEVAMEPGSFDVLGAFYKVRTMELEPGKDFFLDSHADRKNYPTRVRVQGREDVETPAGKFSCLVLEPTLKSGAFFKNEGKVSIWVTDDERRMPVLMKSKIPVGSITVELVEFERPVARAGGTGPAGLPSVEGTDSPGSPATPAGERAGPAAGESTGEPPVVGPPDGGS